MTIYDAIKARLDAGEPEIPVTCLLHGRGYFRRLRDSGYYKLVCEFLYAESNHINRYGNCAAYTEDGRVYYRDAYKSLALGHYDTQLETAKAIAEQNFDTEGV